MDLAADARTALLQADRAAKEAAERPSSPERQAVAAAREEWRINRERVKIEERERAPAERGADRDRRHPDRKARRARQAPCDRQAGMTPASLPDRD
ncbi:hypothetical protein BC360_03180 [Ensifer sp. LC163]|nr:hypothetical protein BC360_03180 [Ensifer sp. LC163]